MLFIRARALYNTSFIHKTRRLYSCDQKPRFDEIKRDIIATNRNLAVINYNTKICFFVSIINMWVSIFF